MVLLEWKLEQFFQLYFLYCCINIQYVGSNSAHLSIKILLILDESSFIMKFIKQIRSIGSKSVAAPNKSHPRNACPCVNRVKSVYADDKLPTSQDLNSRSYTYLVANWPSLFPPMLKYISLRPRFDLTNHLRNPRSRSKQYQRHKLPAAGLRAP